MAGTSLSTRAQFFGPSIDLTGGAISSELRNGVGRVYGFGAMAPSPFFRPRSKTCRKRLHRITAPTLLLWGSDDRVVPGSYAKRFADALGAPVTLRTIEGAGHLADVDAPAEVAAAAVEFLA